MPIKFAIVIALLSFTSCKSKIQDYEKPDFYLEYEKTKKHK